MARADHVHVLRSNAAERSPSRFLVIDTEAHSERTPDREVQTLRLWRARLVHRHGHEGKGPRVRDFGGQDQDQVADLVHALSRTRETLWVYCHNLSYDLVLTRLPLELLARGWVLGKHNLASDTPWGHMKRGNVSVRLADSFSWLPHGLEALGELLGVPKLDLPDFEDSEESWEARCQRDVEITALALERLMDEWDRLKLGWWSLTGAATAWNSMLHLAPYHKRRRGGGCAPPPALRPFQVAAVPTIIDPDPGARQFERQALYSGRRDVWRVGSIRNADVVNVDFELAHCTIAAALPLPDRRGRAFQSLPVDAQLIGSTVRGVIARARVCTDTPRYPLRLKGGIVHPVGEFWTTLAGPELADAQQSGRLRQVGLGYEYRLGVHMQPWAQWVVQQLRRPEAELDAMLRVFLKGAARSVPGRWGMQVAREALAGPSHVTGWSVERAAFGSPPKLGSIFHLAGRWVELIRDQEPDDSFPAVLAYIQAHDRVLLQRALDLIGPDALLQCNTDSALCYGLRLQELAWEHGLSEPDEPDVGRQLDAGCEALSLATRPLTIRVKQWARRARVLSAQHLQVDRTRVFSGVPKDAVEVAPDVFEFWTWPKLAGQLERGDPQGYVRERRRANFRKVTPPRWVYECGCCEAPMAAVRADGSSILLPHHRGRCRDHERALRALQHPLLRVLS